MAQHDDSEVYDPREAGEVVTMESVSLMPNWLGFNAVWAMALVLVCIFFLLLTVPLFYVFPWYVGLAAVMAVAAFDVVILVVALIASIITPNHESTTKYLWSRYNDFRGTKSVKSDTTLPSRQDQD